jgi:DNA-binding beta-propeller fold protein YncE
MRGLSLINKILFFIIIISFFIFSRNVFFANYKNKKAEGEKIYSDLINPIEQKINQAEASLLYNNEDRAIELLDEVKNLMAQLPRKTEGQNAKYTELDKKYNEQMEKLRHVIKIENPKETANFSPLNENAAPENIVFSPVANKIYSGDAEHKAIYIVDLANNSATAKNNLGEEIKALKKPMAGKDENLYYLNGNKIVQFNSKTEEIKILAINSAGHLNDISAAANYNNRIYLLNNKEGQIYRYSKKTSEFADEAPSLKKEDDFSEAVDMAIDGSIYVLKRNSEVLKFFKGSKEEGFKISAIDPGLENASKIFVSLEKDYIYILEPAKQRLVIFDKTGKFVLQYKSDQFTDLKDFTVDENKKIIYFLNNKSVYEVEAKELKNEMQ